LASRNPGLVQGRKDALDSKRTTGVITQSPLGSHDGGPQKTQGGHEGGAERSTNLRASCGEETVANSRYWRTTHIRKKKLGVGEFKRRHGGRRETMLGKRSLHVVGGDWSPSVENWGDGLRTTRNMKRGGGTKTSELLVLRFGKKENDPEWGFGGGGGDPEKQTLYSEPKKKRRNWVGESGGNAGPNLPSWTQSKPIRSVFGKEGRRKERLLIWRGKGDETRWL